MTDNPLFHLDTTIPFQLIKAEHVEPGIKELIADAQRKISQIEHFSGIRTFENTILAMEEATEQLGVASSVVGHLESVATYSEFRDAYNAIQEPLSRFYTDLMLSEQLWSAVKEVAESREGRELSGINKRLLEKTVRAFRRNGAELSGEQKERLRVINVELAKKTIKFSQNVLDSTNAFELLFSSEESLKGLPSQALAAARENAKDKGIEGYRLTLKEPSYIPALTYLEDRGIREQLYRAYNTRAYLGEFDNRALILEILTLREERAKLLGYSNFVDYVLEERMAKNAQTALSFETTLTEKIKEFARKEHEELLTFFKGEKNKEASKELAPWDLAFYAEKLRKKEYDLDQELLRPYFPLEKVLSGMFEVAKNLFGITIEPEGSLSSWHSSVVSYKVSDEESQKVIGYFYTDLHPRESKRGGAWMNELMHGERGGAFWTPHLGLFCANFTQPSGGKPALLTHDEVTTLFHEFGHLLHLLLSEVPIKSLGGTNVAWDFVELPSQILENWCWEKEGIALISGHYETGEPIPSDLFEKLVKAKNFRVATFYLRQLSFGTIDLLLHTEFVSQLKEKTDVVQYCLKKMQEFSFVPLPSEYSMITSFGHLFSGPVGYAGGYYSYLWAEVLESDAFTKFLQEGVLNKNIGKHFRKEVLSKGDSEDPLILFKNFMGRDPRPESMLERAGMTA